MAGKELNIAESTAAYEKWLRAELAGDLVEGDLERKHDKMADDAFQFLRATYWRWAETILTVCPDLRKATAVLAVGDIHVENFGTWRDSEGRLVWGVNDFDEAARMPYALDLARLATSAVLAPGERRSKRAICADILEGYVAGLADPKPHVLDRECKWLRKTLVVTESERKDFWEDFDSEAIRRKAAKDKKAKLRPARKLRPRYVKALESARPDRSVAFAYFERTAGTGSLGRPRFVGIGEWRGDPIIREAKAVVRSSWTLAHPGSHNLQCEDIASGKYRSPDPSYRLSGRVLLRRLSPNDDKIEARAKSAKESAASYQSLPASDLLNPEMLRAMGRDLAAIHRGTRGSEKIKPDLKQRGDDWLLTAVTAATKFVRREHEEWQAG